jgi:hypothetical protein
MTERQRVETEVCKRVCDCASALRAECWPNLGALEAVRIAVKFVLVLERIKELRRAIEEAR